MKKSVSVVLSVLLAVMSFSAVFAVPVNAAEKYTEQDVIFELKDDNTAVVVGCEDKAQSLSISSVLENGYRVTKIADSAFKGNLYLTNFECDASLESIGDYAFETCSHLHTAVFNGGVKEIGNSAFAVCNSLEKLKLTRSTEKIGKGAFMFNKSLAAFSFPSGVRSVGEFAFAYSGVKAVIMNKNLTKIPDRIFYDCNSLDAVVLPSKAESIGKFAFAKCGSLSIEDFPQSIKSIGDNAFEGTSVSEVSLNCETIGEMAFKDCKNLESVTLSDSLKSIGEKAFSGAVIKELALPDGAKLAGGALTGIETEKFIISDTNESYTFADGALYTKDKKTLLAFPRGILGNEIVKSDFTVPDGVEEIAPYAFLDSEALGNVKLPSSLKKIGAYAFSGSGIESVTIPGSVKQIPEGAFMNCGELKSIDFGKIEEIGERAFFGCAAEELEFKLPSTLKAIDPTAFIDASGRFTASENTKLSDGVLFTADGKKLIALLTVSDSTSYTIPDGVEEISDKAFALNKEITTFYVPASLKKIGADSIGYNFEYLNGYKDKILVDGTRIIGDASEQVKSYAEKNNIGVFTAEPVQNLQSVSIKGNATAKFSISNTDLSNVVFTSSNDRIASVASDGTIRGLKKGSTYVTAAVGTTYFKCKVDVTSDSSIAYTGFDDTNYYKVTSPNYAGWKNHYQQNNTMLTESFDESCNLAARLYQANNFYQFMFGATSPDSPSHLYSEAELGKGYEDMILALNHACSTELSTHNNPDSLVLYSGAEPYVSGLISGADTTMKALKSAIGKSFTHPQFVSTTLNEGTAADFYGGKDGLMLIIYAEKTALQNAKSGYIGGYLSDYEYEQLISPESRYEVIDAGVRWFDGSSAYNKDVQTGYQRYVKLKLLGGTQSPEALKKPSITLSKSSSTLYVKKTAQIKPTVNNSYDNSLTYTSSDKKIAKVSSTGKVTAVKKGTATITVKNSEASVTYKVKVKNPKLNKTKKTLKVGKTFTIKITGKAGTPKFTSGKKKIATVTSKGKIKAKKAGKTTITVKTNGIKLKLKLTVKA